MKHTPASEFALLLIKPDAYFWASPRSRILDMVADRFNTKIVLDDFTMSVHAVSHLYIDHVGKPYFEDHKNFMTSGPVGVYLLQRKLKSNVTAPEELRLMIGNTDPKKAAPGTIRQLFGTALPKNAVHASDSVSAVGREARLFFSGLHLLSVGAGALVGSLSGQVSGGDAFL